MLYKENIQEFENSIKKAEKLFILSNFLKNKKLILSLLEEIENANKHLLIYILKNLHAKQIITLSKNSKENKKILIDEIGEKLNIKDILLKQENLKKLVKKHKESPIEFMKKGKVVILDEEQNIETITIQKLKKYFANIKQIKKAFNTEFL